MNRSNLSFALKSMSVHATNVSGDTYTGNSGPDRDASEIVMPGWFSIHTINSTTAKVTFGPAVNVWYSPGGTGSAAYYEIGCYHGWDLYFDFVVLVTDLDANETYEVPMRFSTSLTGTREY